MMLTDDIKILDYVGAAIVVIKNDTRIILYANSQMTDLTCYDLNELKGMAFANLLSGEDSKKFLDLFQLVTKQPDQQLSDNTFYLKRKSKRRLSVSLCLQKIEKEDISILTVLDNTLIKEAEWQLAHAQSSLVESAKFKVLGEMAGGIAHEINNPLAIISGLSQSLMRKSSEPAVQNIAEKINKVVFRISKIISGLKMLSRDHSSDLLSRCKLQLILQETLELCRERFKINGIRLDVTEPPPEAFVEANSAQLSQVLFNLLNNAFEAIKVSHEKWIRISFQETEKYYELHVIDSGPGIPNNIQKKIMEPFFTTKEVGAGTGLGLSISKTILESHSGLLKLFEDSDNTHFAILLPKSYAGTEQENKTSDSLVNTNINPVARDLRLSTASLKQLNRKTSVQSPKNKKLSGG